jgi:hypothetical protein
MEKEKERQEIKKYGVSFKIIIFLAIFNLGRIFQSY